MINLLLDTNIIIDAFSAGILEFLNCNLFSISSVVFNDEVIKQIPNFNPVLFNFIKESYDEINLANLYSSKNKHISFYDALNVFLSKGRNMTLVTGDQQLVKFANKEGVNCIGTIKLLELMVQDNLISAKECIEGLKRLKLDRTRRVPVKFIDSLIEKLEEEYLVNN